MKFKTETIKGRKVDVQIDSSGWFSTVIDGHEHRAGTYDALVKKVQQALRLKATKLEIAIWRDSRRNRVPGTLEHVTLTGLHGGTGNVLVRRADGSAEQDSRWSTDYYSEGIDVELYKRLYAAHAVAEKALEDYRQKFKADPKELVKAELKAAGVDPGEKE